MVIKLLKKGLNKSMDKMILYKAICDYLKDGTRVIAKDEIWCVIKLKLNEVVLSDCCGHEIEMSFDDMAKCFKEI